MCRTRLFFFSGLFCLFSTVHAFCAEPTNPPAFEPIHQAAIGGGAGTPQLLINGKQVVPMIFFYNTGQTTNYTVRFQDPQVRLAADSGVHIYSFLMPSASFAKGWEQVDYSAIEKILDDFIRVDPQAVFILRYFPGPNPEWLEWPAIPRDQLWTYAGSLPGSQKIVSLASDYYWDLSDRGTAAMIRHFESSRYGGRILAYHIGGPEFEMFPAQYREEGPDVSLASTVRFRAWLKKKYADDHSLQKAWGNPQAALATAAVPRGEPGRFPMHPAADGKPIQAFYQLPAEQNWVDYSEYVSHLAADRIIRWAELVRRETAGKKLSVFCYGYLFDLIGSFNGHAELQRVMENPAINILMSPVTYYGREEGDCGGFMSPVDSVAAHGKLWLNENDIRTHLLRSKNRPAWLNEEVFKPNRDAAETVNLLDRDFAQLVVHRSASWWMDLIGYGAFNEPAPWNLLRERLPFYETWLKHPTPFTPDVAVLVDDGSKKIVKSDWDVFYSSLIDLRNQCSRSGVSVGWYTLQDFINGMVPPCKAYLFANAYCLDEGQIRSTRARLDSEKATAIWSYAPGYFNTNGPDLDQVKRLTGIRLGIHDGTQGSKGEGLLGGLSWGDRGSAGGLVLSPRFFVDDPATIPLGRYQKDGLISAASFSTGCHRSIYLGDLVTSYELLGRLFASVGAHRWTSGGEVVLTDGHFLVVHAGDSGIKKIEIPHDLSVQALTGSILKVEGSTIYVSFKAGETLWFLLKPACGTSFSN